jgi:hypothetical protein
VGLTRPGRLALHHAGRRRHGDPPGSRCAQGPAVPGCTTCVTASRSRRCSTATTKTKMSVAAWRCWPPTSDTSIRRPHTGICRAAPELMHCLVSSSPGCASRRASTSFRRCPPRRGCSAPSGSSTAPRPPECSSASRASASSPSCSAQARRSPCPRSCTRCTTDGASKVVIAAVADGAPAKLTLLNGAGEGAVLLRSRSIGAWANDVSVEVRSIANAGGDPVRVTLTLTVGPRPTSGREHVRRDLGDRPPGDPCLRWGRTSGSISGSTLPPATPRPSAPR